MAIEKIKILGAVLEITNKQHYTANPNPVKLTGNPCKSIPTGKNLYSLQRTPVFIAGSLFSLQGFPCISLYFPVRDCSVPIWPIWQYFEAGFAVSGFYEGMRENIFQK